ncbi:hypothetical protein Hanom_Chr12g01099701 [Helianthus anomalus]
MLTYHYITSFCKCNLYLFILIQLFNSMCSLLVMICECQPGRNAAGVKSS